MPGVDQSPWNEHVECPRLRSITNQNNRLNVTSYSDNFIMLLLDGCDGRWLNRIKPLPSTLSTPPTFIFVLRPMHLFIIYDFSYGICVSICKIQRCLLHIQQPNFHKVSREQFLGMKCPNFWKHLQNMHRRQLFRDK